MSRRYENLVRISVVLDILLANPGVKLRGAGHEGPKQLSTIIFSGFGFGFGFACGLMQNIKTDMNSCLNRERMLERGHVGISA